MTTSAVEITGGVEWTVEVTEESGDVTIVSLGYAGPAGPASTVAGPPGDPGVVQSIVAGTNVTVDATDPANPVVSAAGGTGGEVTSDDITDATTVGKAVLTAADAATARTAIGAGTSDLALGTSSITALAGDTAIPSTPADIDAATATQGALADSATQPGDLAAVATSGAYTDLTGTPTLGTAAASDTGDFDAAGSAAAALTTADNYTDDMIAGEVSRADGAYATAAQGAKADTAVQPTRTVAGHALSANVTLVKGDVGLGNVDNTADSAKTFTESQVTNLTTDLAAKVPTTRTVGGHALSADVTLADADISPTAPNDQTGTTYTFVLADAARLVTGNNASAQTFTIPPNSSVAHPLGALLEVYQKGAGAVTLAAGSGVTIRTPRGAKTAIQYGMVFARQVATDVWAIGGDATT